MAKNIRRGSFGWTQVRVGVVVIIALLLVAYGVYKVGSLFDVFADRYELVTTVEDAAGLIEGAAVTLAGQRIGQVKEIHFIPMQQKADSANIEIRLSINRAVQEQIRENSRARIRTQGLLGDRYVDVEPGARQYAVLEAGDTLPAVPALDFEEVLRTASRTLESVEYVVDDLRLVTNDLAQGRGTLGRLLRDDALYDRMAVATGELAALLNQVNRSEGTLARLIRDPTMYRQMSSAVARLDSLGALILTGRGSMGRLLQDDELYEGLVDVVASADTAVGGLNRLVGGLNRGDGTLPRLLDDPALYDEFLKTVVDLQNLIAAIRADPSQVRPQVNVDVF